MNLIIVTQGDEGAFVYDILNKKFHRRNAEKVDVVSTVGAGDSFSASFLAEYLKTKDISKALCISTKISGYVVSRMETIPDYELKDFM